MSVSKLNQGFVVILNNLIFELGYFRVALSFCLKARLNAKFILVQIKLILIFTRKVSHLASFWTVEFLKLGNGPIVFQRICIGNSMTMTSSPARVFALYTLSLNFLNYYIPLQVNKTGYIQDSFGNFSM